MARIGLDQGWTAQRRTSLFDEVNDGGDQSQVVTLPHDAQLSAGRSPERGSAENGYFPSGAVQYTRSLAIPDDYRDKRVTLEFEGVYRDAQVYVNGAFAGGRANGYALFRVPVDAFLRFGQENEIRVEARTHEDTRWYSGMGIHRGVTLIVTEAVHIDHDGIRITTDSVDEELATVEVVTDVVNDSAHTVTASLRTAIADVNPGAVSEVPVTVRPRSTARVRQRLFVESPRLWSTDTPHLHTLESTLTVPGAVPETRATRFGIRTLELDPRRGFRINGEPVKLRGACVHHDNGILGAAAIPRAEERRVEILKSAGFNAIRASHNPLSVAMLDACDRLGMLVMDEAFDMWTQTKMPFDYALAFPEWWERDLESMVHKDMNHPSVVLYSIGNEIPEVGSGLGAARSRELAEKVRELDSTRFVTNAVNGMLAVMDDLKAMGGEQADQDGGINTLMAQMGDLMNTLSASDLVTDRTAEVQSTLDVAGMNYAESRYSLDRELFPDRIIVGTETFPTRIAENWALIQESPNVLGEFIWTGWDYLGETGLGRARYAEDAGEPGLLAGFPEVLAGCGDIDITGHRRPASYFREIVFGLSDTPVIAVDRPERFGQQPSSGPWSWSDSVVSWAWGSTTPGAPVSLEVYSNAEEIELLLDGTPVGRAKVGESTPFRARFETTYQNGELTAQAYVGGEPVGVTTLRSAGGHRQLRLSADRTELRATSSDLAFVDITWSDEHDQAVLGEDREVTVTVEGPATLQGLGSARPSNPQPFTAGSHKTYDGRLLAAIRPTGAGVVRVVAASGESDTAAAIELTVAEA